MKLRGSAKFIRLVGVLATALLVCVLMFALPRVALADNPGANDVNPNNPSDATSTATVTEHEVATEEPNPNKPGETVDDRMDLYSDATVKTSYTFDNNPKAAVLDENGNEIIAANNDNAIQRAVKAALDEIDGNSTVVTIVVKDGVYNGDISIDGSVVKVTS